MNRFVYASCLFLLTGCQQPGALDNADFNLWCGASLCNWKTEQGRIRRVPTWDAEDYGVELVGKPVVISQLAKLNEVNGSCLKFSIVGNVETQAQVQLELDFFDDGIVDYREGIPGVRWQRLDLLVMLPTQPYGSIKVSLDKQGSGTAIFAGLHADGAMSCEGDPIQLSHLVSGDWCSRDADCQSGHCNAFAGMNPMGAGAQATCGECVSDTDCPAGMLCGISRAKAFGPFFACVAPNATPDGGICSSDRECAHGHCHGGVCGECGSDGDCSGGLECNTGSAPDGGSPFSMCVVPGSLPEGSHCTSASDCASRNCCILCLPADSMCPFSIP
jgi:hypothetical protein